MKHKYLKEFEADPASTLIFSRQSGRELITVLITSRAIILLLQIAARTLLPGHENDGFQFTPEENYGTMLDRVVNSTLGGFTNWDGQYFLHIAVNGYTSERMIAFFPLFPLTIGVIGRIFHFFLSHLLSLSSLVIIVGVTTNFICFIGTAKLLLKLTPHHDQGMHHLATVVIYYFAFNPASIFFSALYTESMFAFLTALTILSLLEGKWVKAVLWAALSTTCRSNGLLNLCVCGAAVLQDIVLKNSLSTIVTFKTVAILLKNLHKFLLIAGGTIPFLSLQYLAYWKFCNLNKAKSTCFSSSILPYSHVQKTYWDVGFLGYYQLKQIPNFLLATPVLYFVFRESFHRIKAYIQLVFSDHRPDLIFDLCMAIYGLAICIVYALWINIQVSTRLIFSGYPFIFFYAAKLNRKEMVMLRNRSLDVPIQSFFLHGWFLGYFAVGTVMFSLGLPWT